MNLNVLPLLTDENIDPGVVAYLRSEEFDVLDVIESGLSGSDDEQLLEIAHAQGRVVITHDSDFGTLVVAAGKPFTGIIYLKPGHIQTTFTMDSLQALLNKLPKVQPPFIIVVQHGREGIRIRYRQR